MNNIHKFELKNGCIFLDGMRMRGIREYRLIANENDSFVELSLKMDVRTLGSKGTPEFDSALNESRKNVNR